jgi:hypothetical protein
MIHDAVWNWLQNSRQAGKQLGGNGSAVWIQIAVAQRQAMLLQMSQHSLYGACVVGFGD